MGDQEVGQDPASLLTQYGMYLEDLGRIGEKLDSTKQFHLSILSALLVFLSLAGDKGPLLLIAAGIRNVILLTSIAICLLWLARMISYNKILKSKFRVLQEMEKLGLPFRCVTKEWEYIQKEKLLFLITLDMWMPGVLLVAFGAVWIL